MKKKAESPVYTIVLSCCRVLNFCFSFLQVLYLSDLDQLALGAEHREGQRRLGHPHRGRQTQLLKEDRNVREPEELGRRGQQRRYVGGIGDGSRRGEVPPEQVSELLCAHSSIYIIEQQRRFCVFLCVFGGDGTGQSMTGERGVKFLKYYNKTKQTNRQTVERRSSPQYWSAAS